MRTISDEQTVAIMLSDFLEGRDKAMETAIGILKEQQSYVCKIASMEELSRK